MAARGVGQISDYFGNKFSQGILGLRGVAVLLVVFSHYPISIFKNGFVGVDLFFVISGFLITGQMLREYSSNLDAKSKVGAISLRNFFIRRIARVLPSFILIVALVNVAIYFIGNSALSSVTLSESFKATLFFYNIYLVNSSVAYFDDSVQESLLLPFWSLSVEEQFYFVWPFIFLLAVSWHGISILGKRLTWFLRFGVAIVITSTFSFVIALTSYSINPDSSYFSSISRFWEFGIGAVAATCLYYFKVIAPREFEYSSEIGFLLIIFGTIFISKENLFLSLLPVVVGTSFILMNPDPERVSIVKSFLHSRLLSYFGIISFPLYLIHYPIIKIASVLEVKSTIFTVTIEFLISIAIAHWVHFVIEDPFRKRINGLQKSIEVKSHRMGRRHLRFVRRSYSVGIGVFFLVLIGFSVPGFLSNTKSIVLQQEFSASNSIQMVDKVIPINPQRDTAPKGIGTENSPVIDTDTVPVSDDQIIIDSQQKGAPQLVPSTKNSAGLRITMEQRAKVKKALEVKQSDTETLAKIKKLIENRDAIWGACIDGYSTSAYCNRKSSGQTERSAFLIGDSFALSWYPAIEKALTADWSIKSFTLGECEFARVVPFINGKNFDACVKYRAEIDKRISLEKPDLIVVSSSPNSPYIGSFLDWNNGLVDRFDTLRNSGAAILVIGATPGSGKFSVCLRGNDVSKCNGWAKQGLAKRSIELIESGKNKFAFLDPIPLLCFLDSCPSVINKTPVYWDGSHLNNEFARTLSPFIKDAIDLQYPKLL